MSKHLVPTNAKFIAGAKAFRVWIETDDGHLQVGETFSAAIGTGRRVVHPESRFVPHAPIDIEEYNDGRYAKPAPGTTQKPTAGPGNPGLRVFDDYDDNEVPRDS